MIVLFLNSKTTAPEKTFKWQIRHSVFTPRNYRISLAFPPLIETIHNRIFQTTPRHFQRPAIQRKTRRRFPTAKARRSDGSTARRPTRNWIRDPPLLKVCTLLCTIYSITTQHINTAPVSARRHAPSGSRRRRLARFGQSPTVIGSPGSGVGLGVVFLVPFEPQVCRIFVGVSHSSVFCVELKFSFSGAFFS